MSLANNNLDVSVVSSEAQLRRLYMYESILASGMATADELKNIVNENLEKLYWRLAIAGAFENTQEALPSGTTGRSLLLASTATDAKTVLSLNNVSNTADASKPVSTAQKTEFDNIRYQIANKSKFQRARARLGERETKIVNVAFAGSSTTSGMGPTDARARYVERMTDYLYQAFPKVNGSLHYKVTDAAGASASTKTDPGIRSINQGVPGTTSANYLPVEVRTQLKALNCAFIVHMIGSNDYGGQMALATYTANITTVLNDLDTGTQTTHILVHSWPRRDAVNPTITWEQYGAALKAIADARSNVIYIDASKPFTDMGMPASNGPGYLVADNVHGTNMAHAILADTIISALDVRPNPEMNPNRMPITLVSGYSPRPSYTPEYVTLNGVIYFFGGIQKTDSTSFAAGVSVNVIDFAANNMLWARPTGTYSIVTNNSARTGYQAFITDSNVNFFPPAAVTTIQLDGIAYPLQRLDN